MAQSIGWYIDLFWLLTFIGFVFIGVPFFVIREIIRLSKTTEDIWG